MSGMARPRGPLPARVYWVRRLLVLGIALGLVVGVRTLLAQTSGGDDAGESARTVGVLVEQPAAPVSTADADPADPTGTTATGRKPKRTKTPLPEPKGTCLDPDVTVTPAVERASAGGDVAISLQLTSSLSEACTWTVSPKSVVVRLTSGSDRIWTSQECPRAIPTETVIVRRETPAVVTMTWNGRRSTSGDCGRNTAWALPGYYFVTAASYGGQPAEQQFRLVRPQAPVVTKTAKPKRTATPSRTPKPQRTRAGGGTPSGAVEPGDEELSD